MVEGEAPAYLDTGREMRFEARGRETDEADEGRTTRQLDRPAAIAHRLKLLEDPRGEGVAESAILRTAQGDGNPRIGVERGEGCEIALAPRPQDQAFGPKGRAYIRSGVAMPSSSRHSSSS